jgi:hypothetical protein
MLALFYNDVPRTPTRFEGGARAPSDASVGLVDTGLLDPPYLFTRQSLDIYLAELLDLVR